MDERIISTFCLWCDLLGYSTPFVESGWNLNTEESLRNLDRIVSLQWMFTKISFYPIERILVLNDGFVKTIDVLKNLTQPQQYLYWFDNVLDIYNSLNRVDKSRNYPGARAVLTHGYRYEYMQSNMTAADLVQTSLERKKELEKQVMVYSPREFQMNTAFSKAFIMEGAGSEAGIVGSNLYIDIIFLKELELVLTSNKNAKNFLVDEGVEHSETGCRKDRINELNVEFNVISYEEETFFIWEVIECIEGQSEVLFKLWLDNNYVVFNNKGINTRLFKAVKYKTFLEKDLIIELS